jgi:galectin-3
MVHIVGTAPHSGRFNVNLQSTDAAEPDNIGLHFSVRFDDPYSQCVVVRNHRRHGSWGEEERQADSFPFQQSSRFELLFLAEHDKWKVAVNGKHFIEFAHRDFQLFEINNVGITGDVNITSVNFNR